MNENDLLKGLKSAVTDETPEMLDTILLSIQNRQESQYKIKKQKFCLRLVLSICSVVAVTAGLLIIYHLTNNAATEPLASQINKGYVPFNATTYQDEKMPLPGFPISYNDLLYGTKQSTKSNLSTVILCTVNKVGVYREKGQQYQPRASMGVYIYSVTVNKFLGGEEDLKPGESIAVIENAYAWPKALNRVSGLSSIEDWSFSPYTVRPGETQAVKVNKQYVVFLSPKDQTGGYPVSFAGFGVFPLDYIETVAKTNSLNELENKYRAESLKTPLQDQILYKICALHVKNDFLSANQ